MAEKLQALFQYYQQAAAASDDGSPEEEASEAHSKEIFSEYRAASIHRGLPHPGSIAEATSLSAIQLPLTTYPLYDTITDDIVDQGRLSQLQLESVMYACTKHLNFLPSGERAGFFIGDGAGVGKGRQIAGIILDNYARGRRRSIWLSTSSDLHHDAERDLTALGLHLQVVNNCQTLDKETRMSGLSKDFQEGVLFMTYSTLISNVRGRSRLQQVVDWVGGPEFSGALVMDECHKAKNFVPGKEKQSTKVAAAVLDLQKALPKARVVYCSATGVSEVQHMVYASRLGLWGPGSAFPDFSAFLDSMKRRGVSFLEMLSMEMKAEGYYVARGLSFRDAEFMELVCDLTPEQEAIYNQAVQFWKDLRAKLVEALDATNTTSREVWKSFWSGQQRFFKLLCVSMKVPRLIAEAKAALSNDFSVVIGLQSTGEAAADAMGLQPGQSCSFVSTTQELLLRFVTTHFPTRYNPTEQESNLPEFAHPRDVPSCVVAKKVLLRRASDIKLPPNFLDEIVDKLGGPQAVAEMTGRRGRIVSDGRGRGVFTLRALSDSQEMDSLNVAEKEAFMKGKKLVAIVSDAASTGISLHASADVKNQRRRMHLTIELPWSADKAIQQLGRSHRSNQVSAPIFKLVLSNLGGERRFAAAVARRLQSLGALTRGDRRASSGMDLSESNLDSPLGRKSLKRMYDCIVLESKTLPHGVTLAAILDGCAEDVISRVLQHLPDKELITQDDLEMTVQSLHARIRESLDVMSIGLGAEKRRNDTVGENTSSEAQATSSKDTGDVRRFLNRLLGVEVGHQNLLFSYFLTTLAAEVKAAKEEGRYSEGVSDLPVSDIKEPPDPQVIWTDPHSGLRTLQTDLVADRGISWEIAVKKLEHERLSPDDRSGFMISRRPIFGRTMVILAIQRNIKGNVFEISRPNTGSSFFDMEVDELRQKYHRTRLEEAEETWQEIYDNSKERCAHGPNCQQGPECTFGKRLVKVTILSGSIVRVWGVLENVLQRHEHMLNKIDRTMRVVRVEFPVGSKLIGVRYPAMLLPEVVALLSTAQSMAAPAALLGQAEHAGQLTGDALQAASLGAGKMIRTEAVSPVQPKSLARAFRAPKTVLDFFKPKGAVVDSLAGPKPQHTLKRTLKTLETGATIPYSTGDVIKLDSDNDSPPEKRQHTSKLTVSMGINENGHADFIGEEFDNTKGEGENEQVGDISGSPTANKVRGNADSRNPLTEGMQRLNRMHSHNSPMQKGLLGKTGTKTVQDNSQSMQAILSLGFSEEQALRALKNTQGNVERAVNWLLQ